MKKKEGKKTGYGKGLQYYVLQYIRMLGGNNASHSVQQAKQKYINSVLGT